MIVKMAEKLAGATRRYNPDIDRSFDSLTYQYAIMINTLSVVALTVIIGYIDGNLADTVMAMVAFMALRMATGGYHFKSLDVCVVATVIIFVGIPSIPGLSTNTYLTLLSVSALIVAVWAPTSIPEGAKGRRYYRIGMKLTGLALVSLGLVVSIPAVSVSLFVQASTLIIPRRR